MFISTYFVFIIYCIVTCLCTARRNAHSGAVRTGALESPLRTHRLLRTRGVHVRRAAGTSYAILYSTICTVQRYSLHVHVHVHAVYTCGRVEFSTVHSPYSVFCIFGTFVRSRSYLFHYPLSLPCASLILLYIALHYITLLFAADSGHT